MCMNTAYGAVGRGLDKLTGGKTDFYKWSGGEAADKVMQKGRDEIRKGLYPSIESPTVQGPQQVQEVSAQQRRSRSSVLYS